MRLLESSVERPVHVESISEEYYRLSQCPCDCGGHWVVQSHTKTRPPNGDPAVAHDRLDAVCPGCGTRRTFHFAVDVEAQRYQDEIDKMRAELGLAGDDAPTGQVGDGPSTYYSAILRVMVVMMMIDGQIDDDEIAVLQDIFRELTNHSLRLQEIRDSIEEANIETTSEYLQALGPSLSAEHKEQIIRAALMIALADGEVRDVEQGYIAEIAFDLGVSRQQVTAIWSALSADA